MDALKQYTDLFKEHRNLIDSHSTPIINQRRDEAFEVLVRKPLPPKGSENYETTDLTEILAPDYGLNLTRIDIDVNETSPFRCGVPDISTAMFFLRNDIYSEHPCAREGLPEGIFVGSLKEFCEKFPEEAAKYYGHIADVGNPIVALNTMLAQDGMAIWVRKGIKVDKPIQIVNILQNGMPIMAVRRFLVIAEEESEVRILTCDHTQTSGIKMAAVQAMEVYAGRKAKVDIYEMEESTPLTSRLAAMYVRQDAESRFLTDAITLYNGTTRNEYYVHLRGKEADLKLYGMAITDKERHIDTYSRVEHIADGCHTDELIKYVADENSTGAFAGLIKVERGASKTEAYQSHRNILGSDKARIYSKPQLEIYDDDVKCSHGSATGQLDENQVFYMQTRGIPEKEAKFLLKQAFMADVIDGVTLPGLKERLKVLVEKRFSGEEFNCMSCASGCNGNVGSK